MIIFFFIDNLHQNDRSLESLRHPEMDVAGSDPNGPDLGELLLRAAAFGRGM